MSKQKRPSRKGVPITSHKGGRTDRIGVRVTPETKQMIQAMSEAHDLTMADVVEQAIRLLFDEYSANPPGT